MDELKFAWDPRKASSNARKHGVTFEEAQSAFHDEFGLLLDDAEHSQAEERFVLLGISSTPRLLVVVHAYREIQAQGRIRIISARKATPRESRLYGARWQR